MALMDEIGRTALTNAFINFIRNTCDPSAYRDSLIYDGCRVTNVDETSTTAAVAAAAGEFSFIPARMNVNFTFLLLLLLLLLLSPNQTIIIRSAS